MRHLRVRPPLKTHTPCKLAGLTWTGGLILSIVSALAVSQTSDSNIPEARGFEVKPCSPFARSWGYTLDLKLECVEFLDAGGLESSGDASSCSECLIDAPLLTGRASADGLSQEDTARNTDGAVSKLQQSCVTSPGVLYSLRVQPGSGDGAVDGIMVLACARASCALEVVQQCAAPAMQLKPIRATYWRPLADIISWRRISDARISAKESVLDQFSVPPGVPPYGQFRCHRPMVESSSGRLPPLPSPRRCGQHLVHPISFGVPEEDIVKCLPDKFVDLAHLLPGRTETYIFPMTSFGEAEYKRMYREARFAICPKKSGWETMRLYEILASGAVPLMTVPGFSNALSIPPGAVPFLDKALLSRLASLPGLEAEQLRIDRALFDESAYAKLASDLLDHTQRRLSTKALAQYTLLAANRSHAKKVLYVSTCGHGDYQCYLSLHGMRSLLGDNLVDYPRLPYMYRKVAVPPMREIDRQTPCPISLCTIVSGSTSRPIIQNLGAMVPAYGGGFTYGFRLPEVQINRSEVVIRAMVREHKFDVVVFGNAGALPHGEGRLGRIAHELFQLVQKHYSPADVILIDGRDPPGSDRTLHSNIEYLASRGTYFLREIPDVCS